MASDAMYLIGVITNNAIPIVPNRYCMSLIYTVIDERNKIAPIPNINAKDNISGRYRAVAQFIGNPVTINPSSTMAYPVMQTTIEDVAEDSASISRGKYIFLIMPALFVNALVPPVMHRDMK